MSHESHSSSLPRFSVIVAVYNGARTLQRALDSVFEQTHVGVELIVIDGASTDGTQAIIERNATRIAYWESEPDRGIYHAWNKALDHVTGDWICFLGADDRYHAPEVLTHIAEAIAVDEGRHTLVYGTIDIVREDASVDHRMGTPWDDEQRARFRRGKMIPHPATFHRRSLFQEHGRFDETFEIAGDYEFLLRELLEHDPLFVPELVVDMAIGGISDRPSARFKRMWEVHRARYVHGLAKAPPWRSRRLMGQLLKLWISYHVGPRLSAMREQLARGLHPE